MSGERGVPPVTWGVLALIAFACGTLFAAAAVTTGTDSVVIWIDVGVCLVLTVAFLLVHLLSRTHRVVRIAERGSRAPNWRNALAVLALLVAVLTPPVTAIGKLAGLGQPGLTVIVGGGECDRGSTADGAGVEGGAPPLS